MSLFVQSKTNIENVTQILIIRFSSLGDLVLLTTLLRETKVAFPNAKLHLITSSEFASIFDHHPHLDKMIILNRKAHQKKEFKKIINFLNSQHYDLIFDAHRSLRSRMLLYRWLGIFAYFNSSVHYIDKRNWKRNLLIHFKKKSQKKFPSQREAYCQLLAPFVPSVTKLDLTTELFPADQERQKINQIIQQKQINLTKTIIIGSGASFINKCWPQEYYGELIVQLYLANYEVILLGNENEESILWLNSKYSEILTNLAGQLSYLESVEIIRRSRLVVTNDTALLHFAEAVKVPVISIFGPTVKEFGYAPFLPESKLVDVDLFCRPCSRNGSCRCYHSSPKKCLTSIPVEHVFNLTMKMLSSSSYE